LAGGAAAPRPPAPFDVLGLTAATDPSGQIWVAWAIDDGHDSELFYSRWDGEAWAPARAVHASPDAWESGPSLAIAPDGTAWLAWTSATREDSDVYLSRWLGSRWSEPQVLDRGSALAADEPTLAAAPDGTFWLAWVGEATPGNDEVYVTSWDGRTWAPSQRVSGPDPQDGLYDRQPRLAVGRDGRPWLAWTGHQDGPDDEVYASHWTGSAWTPEQMVSRDDASLDVWPTLVVDGDGRPWLAWKARVEEGEISRLRILISSWDPIREAWSEEALASSPLEAELDEHDPLLSLDEQGRPQLAWLAVAGDSSALALATRQGDAWAEPQLLRAPVSPVALAVAATADGAGALFWADAALDAALPVGVQPLDEGGSPLLDWQPATQSPPAGIINVDPISNRWLAFGDSITWSQYPVDDPYQPPFYPYPSTLNDMLNTRVTLSDVVNVGEPGEQVRNGKDRIKDEVITYTPQYVLIMEGTNDISHDRPPAEVYDYYLIMFDNVKRNAGVDHIKVMIATIIPRLDSRNDETDEMNQQAVLPAAATKNVPVCDQWTAFYNYVNSRGIPLGDIYWDEKHPNQVGLDFFAATWYNCSLSAYYWLTEEMVPPTVWVDALPAESDPGPIHVTWNGSDNLSWVVDYDLQVSLNYGAWTDWLPGTTETGAYYLGAQAGDVAGFRARGRDVVGNQSEWSAPVYTTLIDDVPPDAYMTALPAASLAPIDLSWWAADELSAITAYRVEYRVGTGGTWTAIPGLYPTTATGASFSPSPAQYGQTYYFRASAQDSAGNWSAPSAEVATILAQYSLAGTVYTPRHEPVAGVSVSLDPAALLVANRGSGGFRAYLAAGGSYDVIVSRPDLYGPLPARYDVAVSTEVTGLSFVLPPPDDAVADGGFEAGGLAAWQLGGTEPPTLAPTAHTGLGAVRLGAAGKTASLGQALTPPAGDSPTLSFLVRLEQPGSPEALQIELANSGVLSPPVTYTLPVDGEEWVHVWYELDGQVSQPLTLTFRVSDTAAILLDEVSLGSSPTGIYRIYLPAVGRK
ncbi:MAG: GDSL-type esterase/lipase family protein, partial [Anaerolineae bacterium]